MKIEIQGSRISLQREQWKNNIAYISNYPGLLEEVEKYTWTYSGCEHPYLNCGKLKMSLYEFVLQFLYGEEKLNKMLANSNIIEHLDNNGLNCTYENLHILSSYKNLAKAFSIDKMYADLKNGQITDIPALITDVYFIHSQNLFQMQVFFNKNLVFNTQNNNIVESIIYHYESFDKLFIDWLYCFECIKEERFNIYKNNAKSTYVKETQTFELREDEKNSAFIERNGQYYLVIRTNPENGPIAYMEHTAYRDLSRDNSNNK